ncbi:DUF934 domain-containing protein [Candidatus Phycosocius spiralis]|nr:DUF934 domain-containing protein [Candidatus Phycosocius spiralis]
MLLKIVKGQEAHILPLPKGAFRSAPPPNPLPDMAIVNAGQGDVRSFIRPNVKQPEAPSVSIWEHGPLICLDQWLEFSPFERDQRLTLGPIGLNLMPTDDPMRLKGALAGVAMIAVEFAKFSDGRGYSIATLLRTRLGFSGEVRAVGDVLIDQIFAMARCGFDGFALRGDQDGVWAKTALKCFPAVYQWGADGRAFVLADGVLPHRVAA